MPESALVSIFIDYDNLPRPQKSAGILDIVTRVLLRLPFDGGARTECSVRIYGGWYEGTQITRSGQDLTIEIQRDFPGIIRLPTQEGGLVRVQTRAELAVALLQEPGHHLFNTYRRKGRPKNVRVQKPVMVDCSDPDCVLPLMKKFLKSGACPRAGCAVGRDDLIYRDEQKLVDTMLACDLIYAAGLPAVRIVLLSGDDDFLPPLRTVLLRGTVAIRCNPQPNGSRVMFPPGGQQLVEMDL